MCEKIFRNRWQNRRNDKIKRGNCHRHLGRLLFWYCRSRMDSFQRRLFESCLCATFHDCIGNWNWGNVFVLHLSNFERFKERNGIKLCELYQRKRIKSKFPLCNGCIRGQRISEIAVNIDSILDLSKSHFKSYANQ